jgi:chromosomal replication initiator protein
VLFLYGPAGLGKTHLLYGIRKALKDAGVKNITLADCSTLSRRFRLAVSRGKSQQLRGQYRSSDVLLLDNVHLLSEKWKTQEELVYTISELQNRGKRMVFTSAVPPGQVEKLLPTLRSRLRASLTVGLSRPDYQTRVEILKRMLSTSRYSCDEETIYLIAATVTGNVRELLQALDRICRLRKPDHQEVQSVLAQITTVWPEKVKLEDIGRLVAEEFSVRLADIISGSRSRTFTLPRQICFYLAQKHTSHSLREIGEHFGGKRHSSVIQGCRKIESTLSQDRFLRAALNRIERRLRTLSEL